MGEVVKEFPKVRRGRPEIYPYKQWFNGKKWALTQGVDFHVDPESFKAALYARKNALKYVIVTTTNVADDGTATVYVQRLMGAAAQRRAAANKGLGRKPQPKPKRKTAA